MIRAAGFGEFFTHRTGHNIAQEIHGPGAHLDNLETHDERRILPNTCFSVEPGIYLPEFGVRSEVDMLTAPGKLGDGENSAGAGANLEIRNRVTQNREYVRSPRCFIEPARYAAHEELNHGRVCSPSPMKPASTFCTGRWRSSTLMRLPTPATTNGSIRRSAR